MHILSRQVCPWGVMNDWPLVNLFVPTLLPLVFLSAFFLFDLSTTEKAQANPLVAIKDGQLSWAGHVRQRTV